MDRSTKVGQVVVLARSEKAIQFSFNGGRSRTWVPKAQIQTKHVFAKVGDKIDSLRVSAWAARKFKGQGDTRQHNRKKSYTDLVPQDLRSFAAWAEGMGFCAAATKGSSEVMRLRDIRGKRLMIYHLRTTTGTISAASDPARKFAARYLRDRENLPSIYTKRTIARL